MDIWKQTFLQQDFFGETVLKKHGRPFFYPFTTVFTRPNDGWTGLCIELWTPSLCVISASVLETILSLLLPLLSTAAAVATAAACACRSTTYLVGTYYPLPLHT